MRMWVVWFLVAMVVLSLGAVGCAGGSASAPAHDTAWAPPPEELGCGPHPVPEHLERPSLEDAFDGADLVFVGRVGKIHDPIPLTVRVAEKDMVLDYALEVYRVWKGGAQDTIWVRSHRAPESGGFPFRAGEVYLIYAHWDGSFHWTSRCTRNDQVSGASADLYQLGKPTYDDGSGRLPNLDRETLALQLRALSPNTRRRALRLLEQIAPQDPGALPIVLEAYADALGADRLAFIATLGRMGEAATAAVPVVIEATGDEDSTMRAMAAASLGKMGLLTPEVLPTLIAMLEDEDPAVRSAAAQAFAVIGPAAADAAPALRAILNDPETRVRDIASRALQVIGGASP